MNFILLSGAGFSHNWGGPLASDVFSALLADKDIDDHTRDLLFDSGAAFEAVLADLQLSKNPDLRRAHNFGCGDLQWHEQHLHAHAVRVRESSQRAKLDDILPQSVSRDLHA
jgi:hypothetical protein